MTREVYDHLRAVHRGDLDPKPVEASRYGPPRPPDPWPTVTINSGANERQVPAPRDLVDQRRQINALAYLGDDWPLIVAASSKGHAAR